MYSINKKSTRKSHIKKNKITKRKVGKNSKKRTSKKNKITKKYRKTKKGGSPQTYYWSPMRKLQFNPDLDSTLNEFDRPRMDITDPVYNCKNPVTVIQTDQSGGAYVVGNNEQTVGNSEISTECPYEAQGASSYAYNYPPGLSNGLIIQNNDSQNGGTRLTKVNHDKPYKSTKKPFKNTPSRNNADLKQNFENRIIKYRRKKEDLITTYPEKKENIEPLMNELIELCENVISEPTGTNYNNFVSRSKEILQEVKTIIEN